MGLADRWLVIALAFVPATDALAQEVRWYRGNTHAHTSNSDGDSPPEVVARWYKDHGYHFTLITDHEQITPVDPLNAVLAEPGKFLVIRGQEITQLVRDSTHFRNLRQVHVNALGAWQVVMPIGERNTADGPVSATYTRNIAEVRRGGGVAQVNHPNWHWSIRLNDLLVLPDSVLFEVHNAHPGVNNEGGVDDQGNRALSTEALWDSLLTRGKRIFMVADDDSHSFKPENADRPDLTRPGRGWIQVRADTLTAEAIVRALGRGDFYGSNGVTLRDIQTRGRELRVDVAPRGDRRYTTEFIGRGGRVLATVTGTSASYSITGGEGYVRARVTDSQGRRAWTQPVWVE